LCATVEATSFAKPLDALRFHAECLNDILVDLHGWADGNGVPLGGRAADDYIAQVIHQADQRVLTMDASYALVLPASSDLQLVHKLQKDLLDRNARCRILFDQEVASDESVAAWPQHLVEAGATVRLCPLQLPTVMLVDGRFALTFTADGQDGRLTVVRDRAVLDTLRSLYSAMWDHAVNFGVLDALRVGWATDDMIGQVLELLGSGCGDEAASRKLDVSVRTYRRRVAELMALLGAKSRFHAGVRAAQLGLVRDHELSEA
jgi:hypothetical protein